MPSAAILAGGQAIRFGGRDKSGLVVGGRAILERQIDELAQIADDILIVGHVSSRPPGPGGEIVIRHIPDRVQGAGPLGGLDAALAAAHRDPVVVLACDMPFVSAAFLRYLVSLAGQAEAVVPRTKGRDHPLCAVYARGCQSAIDARLAAGQLSMAGLLEGLRVRAVREHEVERFGRPEELLANINTPAEFDELAAASGHGP